jgi:hypothetical protein
MDDVRRSLDYARPDPPRPREWLAPVAVLTLIGILGAALFAMWCYTMANFPVPSDPPFAQPAQSQPDQLTPFDEPPMTPSPPSTKPGT